MLYKSLFNRVFWRRTGVRFAGKHSSQPGRIGRIAGTTALHVERGRPGEIGGLYVVPELRRRGVAGALIEAAAARSAELGCSALSVISRLSAGPGAVSGRSTADGASSRPDARS